MRKLFSIWFGLGAPLYFLSLSVFLYFVHPSLAAVTLVAYIWRVYDSFKKTCSRCQFYGTGRCGLPSLLVPIFFQKKKSSLSQSKIKLHYFVDLSFMALAGLGYFVLALSQNQGAYLLFLVWPIGAWLVSFKKKRFHGLLHELKKKEGFVPPLPNPLPRGERG